MTEPKTIASRIANLPCGHPASLLIKSVESDYQFCELCEMRSERDDAVKMEAALSAALAENKREIARLKRCNEEGLDSGTVEYIDELNRKLSEMQKLLKEVVDYCSHHRLPPTQVLSKARALSQEGEPEPANFGIHEPPFSYAPEPDKGDGFGN